jgi:hypothetical protein
LNLKNEVVFPNARFPLQPFREQVNDYRITQKNEQKQLNIKSKASSKLELTFCIGDERIGVVQSRAWQFRRSRIDKVVHYTT